MFSNGFLYRPPPRARLRRHLASIAAFLAVGLTACGGGSSGSANNTNPTPTVTSPSITTQPQSAFVNAGTTATFSVAAGGTAPLSYQWLRNGQPISGATSASYTTAALSTSDNGAIYTVTVSNSAGTQTSDASTLTVNTATVSVLANRAWTTTGTNINVATGTANVQYYKSGMADDGTIVAVYAQSSGSRLTLYGSVGTPNAPGSAPTWTTQPVVLDGSFNFMPTQSAVFASVGPASARYGLNVSPNGNAFAFWANISSCTANSHAPTASLCMYFYGSRYIKNTSNWEPAKLIASSLASYRPPIARINNRGDVAVLIQGWSGNNGETSQSVRRAAVARLVNGQAEFSLSTLDWQVYNPISGPALGETIDLGLDNNGNILVVGARWPTGSTTLNPTPPTKIAAAQGTIDAGFSVITTIDTLPGDARLMAFKMGSNGDAAIAWSQNNGSISDSLFAANLMDATGTWIVKDFSTSTGTSVANLAVSDDGIARLFIDCTVRRWNKNSRAWAATTNLPTDCALTKDSVVALTRDGKYISFRAYAGISEDQWSTYDDTAPSTMVHSYSFSTSPPASSYILGMAAPFGVFSFTNSISATPLLSTSGIGALMVPVDLDQLPNTAAPLGIGRNGFNNVWGLYLK